MSAITREQVAHLPAKRLVVSAGPGQEGGPFGCGSNDLDVELGLLSLGREIDVHRAGSRHTFGAAAPRYYRQHLAGERFDLVVDALGRPAYPRTPLPERVRAA